jgi:HK97 family phage major capsid protein
MNLIKLIKSIIKAGFITKAQKDEIKKGYEALDEDDKEIIAADYKSALALPSEKKSDEPEDDEITNELKKLLGGVKDEVLSEVKEKVNSWLKEQKELMEKKVGVYNEDVQEKRKSMNIKIRGLAEAVLRGDETKLKEMSTDSSGSPYAGYVVDSELSAEIRHLITEYGVARREMLALQLQKNSYKANNLATDMTVYWVDEEAAISSSQVVLGQETLELKKLASIVSMTSELLEDQEIDLASFITSRVAEGMAKKEDEAFFKGDGTSTYGSFTGLLNNTSVNEVTMTGTTFASVDADDLIDMKDATPAGALANAKYYLHRSIMSYIRKLKDDNNQYIYQAPSQAGPGTIWGDPIVLVEAMPTSADTAVETSFVLYGDLKKACILGYKGAINAKRFDAGVVRNVAGNADVNLITSDREAIRFTERVGFITILPTAVTKLTTAAASA